MAASVTVTLPSGTKVTCSPDLASRLGVKPKAELAKPPAKKAAAKKSAN